MTATIIRFPSQTGPAIRALREDAVDRAFALLRIAELRSGVKAMEATGEALERLDRAVREIVEEELKGRVLL